MLPLPSFDYDDQMTNNFNNFRNLKALNHKTTRVMGAGRAKVNKKCTERDKDVHIVKECQTLMIGYITSLFSCMFNSKKYTIVYLSIFKICYQIMI